jgi:hypothetical protein
MEFRTEYRVTEAVQTAAARQMFHAVYLKKKWVWMVAMAVIGVVLWFQGWSPAREIGLADMIVAGVLAVLWVKTYVRVVANARTALRTLSDDLVTLRMGDEGMEMEMADSRRRLLWEKVDRVVETGDFMILVTGRLPVASLPKAALGVEVVEWLRGHAGRRAGGAA